MPLIKNFDLFYPTDTNRSNWVSERSGEHRLGQKVCFRNEQTNLSEYKFHVLGISESAGPRANGGFPGSENAFPAFITRFLSMQSNRFLTGESICINGYINQLDKVEDLNAAVEEIDLIVTQWTEEVVAAGGIPIVIGGGHNNAYGIIKGASLALKKTINLVNMDPHADVRDREGRHSGNAFNYAWKEGFLGIYNVLGLHESYNNEAILNRLEEMSARVVWFETWIDNPQLFYDDVEALVRDNDCEPLGIELDMDAIIAMPTSARTPSGITMEQARFYIRKTAAGCNPLYLHLPEASPLNAVEESLAGKALAYLVTDFIKAIGAKG